MARSNALAQALAAGELVAFPTETVYGLGARADDDRPSPPSSRARAGRPITRSSCTSLDRADAQAFPAGSAMRPAA